ncbi:hypothetical protein LWI29_035659 [Acer saccharum]|uniref:Protein kinase domain-containing protein n=1 Tax=Acer saccharum TaxID=4024 RepID=A0AA39VY93_ACESA|nr:hypothetical protein LWI29_035659 [Acer saccharum]
MGLSGTCLRLVVVQLLLLMVANASLTTDYQIAKPDCPTDCGELKSIPYPFGTEPGCVLNEDFLIDCDDNSIPRIQFRGNASSSLIVTNISMEGQIQVQSFVSEDCYPKTGEINRNWTSLQVGESSISDTKNKFTVIGCGSYGYIQGKIDGKSYSAGCMSTCERIDDVPNGSCSGFGCCQIDIPKDLKQITVKAYSFAELENVPYFKLCSYAFVIEDSQFHFSSSNLSSITDTVPAAVDWAITGQGKCEEAINNPSYACKENSFCQTTVTNNTGGYLCKCRDGYQGNPYLSHGCQDIDECKRGNHTCGEEAHCKNIQGSYSKNNFDEKSIIGSGGYGTVYKGFLIDNNPVAIKKSKIVDQSQIEQFINEVTVLSQINHRNVVKLLGCCLETEVPLLVYEYITNGTLFDHIHNNDNAPTIPWETRLRIAAETAGVLSYLHSAAATPIIHRDVKSSNILLDDNFIAKVSDFGASKLVPMDVTQLSTMVQGTLGYLDPEYLHTSQLTEKSDVYSFGVVLVELMTGKKVVSFDRPEQERSLVIYFLFSLKQSSLFEILENGIVNDDNKVQMREVAELARRCLIVKGEERPTMKEVAMELEGLRRMNKHLWDNVEVNIEETEHLLFEKSNACDGSNSNVANDSMIALVAFDGGR